MVVLEAAASEGGWSDSASSLVGGSYNALVYGTYALCGLPERIWWR